MSIALTPEELAEIAWFARTYPEAVPQMMQSADPRELLERVRLTIHELKEETDKASQQRPEVVSQNQPPDRSVPTGGESHRTRRPRGQRGH